MKRVYEMKDLADLEVGECKLQELGALWSAAQQAAAWMFVYPRDPKLITKYIDTHGDTVDSIVWLGPRVDWSDYEPRFSQSPFSEVSFLDQIGLTPYDTVVVEEQPVLKLFTLCLWKIMLYA